MALWVIFVTIMSWLTICQADDLQREYYTTVTFSCDPSDFNFTSTAEIKQKYWLGPTGELLNKTQRYKDGHYKMDPNLTLTIDRIDDDDFGYFICLLVRSDYSLDEIKHGLNINGPYYGDLLKIYSEKAMIGGIAAGSLFVVLAGFCIVWQLRYHKRHVRNKAVDELDKAIDGYDLKAYNNVGLEIDDEDIKKPYHESTSGNAANGETVIAEENRI